MTANKFRGCGYHGSAERKPGEFFRALAALYLEKNPKASWGALARGLHQRLQSHGIKYHERTLRRQLSGSVSTVPPEVETTMRRMLLQSSDLRTDAEIEGGLSASGIAVPERSRLSKYIFANRMLPLVHLWLHLNPARTKRFLARRLRQDFGQDGLDFGINALLSTLAGNHMLVRREMFDKLLAYLAECGVTSEAQAKTRLSQEAPEIRQSLQSREFVSPQRFLLLCQVWRLRHHEASTRSLALLLQQRISRRGLSVSHHHIQNLINGRTSSVRRGIVTAMEELVRTDFPNTESLNQEVAEASSNKLGLQDLGWVRAEPIAALARQWVSQHPGHTMRQLALRLSRTIRRMGYSRNHNTTQSILGGWKKKTRGFVYRAMLRQFKRRHHARIPAEHFVRPAWSAEPERPRQQACRVESTVRKIARTPRSTGIGRKPELEEFMKQAREYLPSARYNYLLEFLALRATRLYGIPRARAVEQLLSPPP